MIWYLKHLNDILSLIKYVSCKELKLSDRFVGLFVSYLCSYYKMLLVILIP